MTEQSSQEQTLHHVNSLEIDIPIFAFFSVVAYFSQPGSSKARIKKPCGENVSLQGPPTIHMNLDN